MRKPATYTMHTDYSDYLRNLSAKTGEPQSHIIERALHQTHQIATPPGIREKNGRKPNGWRPEGNG